MMEEKKALWEAPEMTEMDIADETMSGDGTSIDGTDPAPMTS
jgi:hypothetical protein